MNRSQRVEHFHDWLEITGFDIRCQRDLTAWHVTHHARVARLDIAAHSALVRMGVAVANVALKGTIRLYDQLGTFEAEVERILRETPSGFLAEGAAAKKSAGSIESGGRPYDRMQSSTDSVRMIDRTDTSTVNLSIATGRLR